MLLVAKDRPKRPQFDGTRLREMRERADMTQAALAQAAGVHVVNLSQYERGKVVPSFEVACRLADALGVDVGELRGG